MGQNDRDEEAPRERPPTPQAGRWLKRVATAVGSRWKQIRKLLLVAEAGLVLTKHEAPAVVARALVMMGDVIFEAPDQG